MLRVPRQQGRRLRQRPAGRLAESGAGWLSHGAAAELLAAGEITVPGVVAGDVDAAVTAAARCGYPVAVKTADPLAVHRTEQGLVRTGIGSATELADVLGSWQERQGAFPVVVQPMCSGTEIALGIVRDPVLGPLIMVGAGGVNVDVWDDRTWLLPPVSPADASRAVRSLRVWRLLRGHRGAPRGDVIGLERMILTLSRLALEVPEVAELDLNPVLVGPGGCSPVDVKVRLAGPVAPEEPAPRQLREVLS
ncbi:acetate--CoA ligase family protein [Nocardioides bigeumensis]|uniref:acetate--CoA ligase family protein n=1 Tax=Nocardioides bigeumensis TaxID=433657 RepID=UPI0031D17D2E